MEKLNKYDIPQRGRYLLTGIAALLVLLFIIGFIPRWINSNKIDALAYESRLPQVSVIQIEPSTKPTTLTLPSSAQAWHITPIWARVNGYLLEFLVDIGDSVKKGDLLAQIDTPETDQEVERARADLVNAQAERDIAKITKERWERLWNKNQEAVSKQEVDQYLANYQSAEAIVTASEKALAGLIYQQQFKYVYAPFDGVIIQRSVDIGSLIYGSLNGAPQELFQIAQTDTIRFFVNVPQSYYKKIRVGLEAEVTLAEFPNRVFKGTVTRYAKALDPMARTLLTQVDVPNENGPLYAGLFGRVTFVLPQDSPVFRIPTTALVIRNGPPQVAVIDQDNIVHLKPVQIGLDYGKNVEIVSGLETGDRVITLPTSQIREGQKVEVQDNPPKTEKLAIRLD